MVFSQVPNRGTCFISFISLFFIFFFYFLNVILDTEKGPHNGVVGAPNGHNCDRWGLPTTLLGAPLVSFSYK